MFKMPYHFSSAGWRDGRAGKILNLIELKGLSEDVMKSVSDKENPDREFGTADANL